MEQFNIEQWKRLELSKLPENRQLRKQVIERLESKIEAIKKSLKK